METRRGFTLIELIAVTAIVSFLAYLSLPFGESVYNNSREESTMNALDTMRNALDTYYRDHGYYPPLPTFTYDSDEVERFSALQVLERELAGKEYQNYPDKLSGDMQQRVYLSGIPPNPFTGKREDWEVRDSYMPIWHPVNEAMNPAPDLGTTGYGTGGEGTTGTYDFALPVIRATAAYSSPDPGLGIHDNDQKTRDIFDIRFPEYLNKEIKQGKDDWKLSEF